MDQTFFLGLIYNASLLLALIFVFDAIASLLPNKKDIPIKIVAGFVIGGICLAVMSTNWQLINGVVFDTRSVLLATSGLFFGFVPTLIATVISVWYRLVLGGSGVYMGVSVAIASSTIGWVWGKWKGNSISEISWKELYFLGVVVHVVMLLLTGLLPKDISLSVFRSIFWPVILIYPFATMFLGLLLSRRLKRNEMVFALKESEEKYKTLIEQAADGVFLLDRKGDFVLVNSETIKMFGYKENEMIGMSVFDTYVPSERDMGRKYFKEISSGKDMDFSRKALRKDGTVFLMGVRARKLSDDRMQAFVRDITKKEKAQQALKESEEKFYQVFQNGPQVITISSLETGEYIDVNNAFTEVIGYKKNEVIGKTVFDLNIWADKGDRGQMISELKKNGVVRNKEYKFRTKKGEIVTCLCSLTTVKISGKSYLLVLGVNIEDRKRAERDLAKANLDILEEKQKLESVLRDIGDAVFVTDNSKKVTMTNYAAQKLIGLGDKQMRGKVVEDLLGLTYESSDELCTDILEKVFNQKATVRPKEPLIFRTKDGTSITLDGVISPILGEMGETIGTVWVLRDITKAREVDKMKSDFVSMASHQLRTPLTGIKWFAELLSENVNNLNKDQTLDYAKKIAESNDRLIELVNDLVSSSRLENGKMPQDKKVYKLKDLLKMAMDQQGRSVVDKNIEIQGVDSVNEELSVMVDKIQIVQVFGNLINNAANYSPVGSKIVVIGTTENGTVKVAIKDQGLGIPKYQQGKVFDKFFRADNVAKNIPGSGLGLYIAKKIVEDHKGRIWFESEEGNGTTFYVELPLAQS